MTRSSRTSSLRLTRSATWSVFAGRIAPRRATHRHDPRTLWAGAVVPLAPRRGGRRGLEEGPQARPRILRPQAAGSRRVDRVGKAEISDGTGHGIVRLADGQGLGLAGESSRFRPCHEVYGRHGSLAEVARPTQG